MEAKHEYTIEFMTLPKSSNIATSIFSVHIILAMFLYNWGVSRFIKELRGPNCCYLYSVTS